ncbi:MAG: alpha/beta fold hydrolase [Gordonia sp. (in: high G+C Gram-positive bacteria)]|uniref:alpha/beta fold hydrolase n=1 Tax=Gordonia sp. (in: high G+C Gram-positive bacteria) TaxID=84139 RepID=UPI0039E390D1
MEQYSHAGFTFDVVDTPPTDPDRSRGTVVLLHGFPQGAYTWDALTPMLNARGFRTVCPDQRGYSPGARPKGRINYRTGLLVDDAAALIEQLGDGPVHVVGHDWGAVVAWRLAASRPDLVRTLTAVSVPHSAAYVRSLLTSDQAVRSWYIYLFQPPFLAEQLAKRFPAAADKVLRSTGMDDELLAATREKFFDRGSLPGSLNWYRAMMLNAPHDMTRHVAVPTTHVWSTNDVALARKGAQITGEYVDADFDLRVIEGADHWLPEHRTGELAEIVLDRIDPQPESASQD